MSETKHTPGPWKAFVERGVGWDVICVHLEKDAGPHLTEVVAWTGFDSCDIESHDEQAANAYLIAAVTDLLAACVLGPGFSTDGATLLEQAAYELRQHGPHLHTLADELERKAKLERAAIAKVRGEVA